MNGAATARVRGRVTTPRGDPVGQAVITVLSDAGRQTSREISDEQGDFVVELISPGCYTVVVSASGQAPAARTTTVTDGQPVSLGAIVLSAAPRAEPSPQAAAPAPASAGGGTSAPAIVVEGLVKTFGTVEALRGIDLTVASGTVLGLLGPNGAGKTTAVRILTTLLSPTAGRATIEGHDVVRDPAAVRRVIGLAGQSAAIQEELTGRENLEIVGRLYHLGKHQVRRRATELLERFDLLDAADRPAKTFSGGMQRRLDLAASLVARPSVLFLDEPTTGLDPRSRLGMWQVIRDLAAEGTTLLLTTQYLEEADELADEIVVIDHGLVIAAGTAEELKDRVGGDVLEFRVVDRSRLGDAASAVADLSTAQPQVDTEAAQISLPVGVQGSQTLAEVVRRLDGAGIEPGGLGVRRPSLDDVFLSLTGHAAEAEAGES